MKINNIEYEIDFTEADFVEKYQKAYDILQKELMEVKEENAEGIRQECKIIRKFLDNVLGEGEGNKIIIKDSLNLCINALQDLKEAKDNQDRIIEEKLAKYSPDRLRR